MRTSCVSDLFILFIYVYILYYVFYYYIHFYYELQYMFMVMFASYKRLYNSLFMLAIVYIVILCRLYDFDVYCPIRT